jgi:anti-sigma regulatory factor (Ser/Thr protein kinase)
MSFASTLYLCPILDLLLANIPQALQAEIRLGLQEALVNAAKHGNKLDPSKTVIVQFFETEEGYAWIISDEGSGFTYQCECHPNPKKHLSSEEAENGRGLCILHEIFDQVNWERQGSQLKLCKQVKKGKYHPLLN